MDLIHKFINVILPIISLIAASFFLPPFLLFKFLSYCVRSLFTENIAGKVVLITGASSGIGEYLAYEYAKRGAYLVLVARRKDRLQTVAAKTRQLGSPDVIVIPADVSKVDDCKRFVDAAVNHFGRLNHLVNNAGIAPLCYFDDYNCVTDHASIMNINFWGSVYGTHFAVPHLRKSKGKIIVISSCVEWCFPPRLSIYNASKAALVSFYETLRTELGSDIGITIVTPGIIESEITDSEFLSMANMKSVPLVSTEGCAKAILDSTRRGDRYLTEPAWMKVVFLWQMFCPEVLDWLKRMALAAARQTTSSQSDTSKEITDATKMFHNSASTQSPEFKADQDHQR